LKEEGLMTQTTRRKALTAHQILKGGVLRELEIPEWGEDGDPGVVYLAEPRAGEMLEFAAKQEQLGEEMSPEKTEHLIALIAQCIVDEKGKRIFSEDTAMQLQNVSISVFNRMANAITKMAEGVAAEGNASSEAETTASPID